MADSSAHIADLAEFVAESPSAFHAAAALSQRLERAGFTEFDESTSWEPTTSAFVVRGGTVIAWRVPPTWSLEKGIRIVGSHTDSPGLKVKPEPMLTSAGWQQVGVEVYGGPLLLTWLDRELGVAGRLVDRQGRVRLVTTAPILRVPHLAPHLDRSLADHVQLDRQQHLQPVYAVGPTDDLRAALCAGVGFAVEDLAGHDLFCYPTQPSSTFGFDGELFASWRLDNLSSVHASAVAFLDGTSEGEAIQVLAAFDHEEVGSATRSGASGPFLADVLRRITASVGVGDVDHLLVLAMSSCLSADAGHAVHPNYANHHDPSHQPVPNAGPLLKINAMQRYATDAVGAALWSRVCAAAGVPSQTFVSNNVIPCGSTIGPLTATRLGVLTVDVGIPLLSMHSARELCGIADPGYLAAAMSAYWAGA